MPVPKKTVFFAVAAVAVLILLLLFALRGPQRNSDFVQQDFTDRAKPALSQPAAPVPASTAGQAAHTETTSAREGSLTPFEGYDLDGKPLDVEACIGKQPVMLVFWATWCPTCKEEIPYINSLVRQFAERGMAFFGVNVGQNDTYKRAKAFAVKYGMQYPTYFDQSSAISMRYGVRGLPTVVIADKKGIVRYYGFSAPQISEAIFQELTKD